MNKFVKRTQDNMQNDFLYEFAQEVDYKAEDILEKSKHYDEEPGFKYPPYLFRESSAGIQLYKALLGILLAYEFCLSLFIVCISDCIEV